MNMVIRSVSLRLPLLAAALGATVSCGGGQPAPRPKEGSGHAILRPLTDASKYVERVRQLVYVPVYSSIYWGFDQQTIELAATLSIRNVSSKHRLVVHSVRYFDSGGKEVHEYVPAAATLAPMATADFVIQRHDTTGGPGANFLVDWSSAAELDDPVIEAIMVGQHGNAGISFSSVGRPLPKASAERAQPASK